MVQVAMCYSEKKWYSTDRKQMQQWICKSNY